MSENLDRVCRYASEYATVPRSFTDKAMLDAISALRAEFAELERKAASAIIPTPELREAVKTVCCMADEAAIARPIASSFAGRFATVALVRAAFKENDNE